LLNKTLSYVTNIFHIGRIKTRRCNKTEIK